jgi:hypothetical protein
VTSGRWDRASPSLSALCGHPRHRRTTTGAVATSRRYWDMRGQDIATTATVPRTGFPSTALELAHHGGRSTNYYAATLEAAPVRAQYVPRRLNGSGIRQDGRQLRSTIRHSATRIEIVQRACKLLPPWPINGGGGSPPAAGDRHGMTGSSHFHALRLPHDIGTRLNQTSGTWRPCLLSRLACSHPSTSTTAQAIQCPEHTAAGRTAPAGTRINQVSLVA